VSGAARDSAELERRDLRCRAVRWVSDDFPGWVEVEFVDAFGRAHRIVDKWPIFGFDDEVGPTTSYPIDGWIQCRVIGGERVDGRTVVRVRLMWSDTVDGAGEFLVEDRQVVELPSQA
jgi:hypothetical protein